MAVPVGKLAILVLCFGALVFLDTCCIRASATESNTDDVKATTGTVDTDIGAEKEASRTDTETVKREEEAIQLDGLNVAQMRELRDKAQKRHFEAEVNRMMKIIINSLYKNKEIFIRELISNASDALDKIRFLSLTDKAQLDSTPELSIRIKSNPEAKTLHFIDTGIGMTLAELTGNLGTIAKSGTSEFFERFQTAQSENEQSDLIGQFGVGFYSSFLVSDRVTVVSKHNNESIQHIWESDGASNDFTIADDPRGSTLKRGTEVILHLKDEAKEYLDVAKLKDVIKKYSQFINFNIYLWTKKTEMVDEPEVEKKEEKKEGGEEEGKVEEEKKEGDKKKKVEKTTWDWELINDTKPIWTRKTSDVTAEEYTSFYKALGHDSEDPLSHIHFTAEGEVAFKSILYVPKSAPYDMFQNYGKKTDYIKLYVRRVFITDNFEDLMPKYLIFIKGVVDSDDLPLNVSRETLQQNKLLKVIKKKLVRKVIEMLKKLDKADYEKFWKEYSTNIKLGVIEDQSNRSRLAPLLRFLSSHSTNSTSLEDYISRMKDKQEFIYYIAGSSLDEVKKSPFVEKLAKRGYEVLYLPEPVDEYCIQSLPEFKSKKFQNAAKEGLKMVGDDSVSAKERREAVEKEYKTTVDWLKDVALKDKIEKAVVSERLVNTPCALVASQYGWSGNMERIMRSQAYAKSGDPTSEYYLNQKKIFEINPRHPLVKELHNRVLEDKEDKRATELAELLFDTATLRSGFYLKDSVEFAERVERMLRTSYGVSPDAKVEDEPEPEPEPEATTQEKATDEKEIHPPGEKKAEAAEAEHEEL